MDQDDASKASYPRNTLAPPDRYRPLVSVSVTDGARCGGGRGLPATHPGTMGRGQRVRTLDTPQKGRRIGSLDTPTESKGGRIDRQEMWIKIRTSESKRRWKEGGREGEG